MKKIYDKKTGKLKAVELYRTEQHMLMKQNIASLRAEAMEELTRLAQEIGEYDNISK